ncbi:MAG: hypothetical protein NTW87_09185 [Planctomycetota bacterium]|nr:hypothetical protein [Planctomycetota bacterium]
MLRGGAWLKFPRHCRSARRYGFDPDSRGIHIGVRVVVDVTPRTPRTP